MKKPKIRMLKIFSSVALVLGMTTACSNQTSPQNPNTDIEEEITENTPEVTESDSGIEVPSEKPTTNRYNIYETNEQFDSESKLLKFIESRTEDLKKIGQSEPVQHVKDTIIHSGLALTDFILLDEPIDEPIGGMHFRELTSKGKEVVMNCLFAVDTMAKEKVPEQYETFKQMVTKVKNKFKEIVIDVIGEENYEYFGESKDKVIEKGKDYWEKGKQKYKDWRENKNNQ